MKNNIMQYKRCSGCKKLEFRSKNVIIRQSSGIQYAEEKEYYCPSKRRIISKYDLDEIVQCGEYAAKRKPKLKKAKEKRPKSIDEYELR